MEENNGVQGERRLQWGFALDQGVREGLGDEVTWKLSVRKTVHCLL